jgi:hypothetical protein
MWRIRWCENINRGGEPTTLGPVLGWQMCWRSAGCRQLRNTFANNVTPLPCMWQHGLFLEVCREGKWQRGLMPRQWWWEQPMSFE